MLFVLFRLGKERYALNAAQVAEVLPLVSIKHMPQAPPGVAGAFNYHGAPVPVIDLSELALGQPARTRLSTRIIVVQFPDAHGATRLLGLIAEHATETMRRDATDFVPAGITNDAVPYLGPVVSDARGLVQRIEVNQLLPASVRDVLFNEPAPR
jgi:chemotaxis-related protein WspB